MARERKTKRQLIRDERRAKRDRQAQESVSNKRRRLAEIYQDDNDDQVTPLNETTTPTVQDGQVLPTAEDESHAPRPEREFFGMLAEDEQEYFRRADELLELNDFPAGERSIFLQNVYKEAEGKELKIASSQSCSRLMERLILLSTSQQKKKLFEAFAGHFLTLVTHRFASHCCEKLFLQSAGAVSRELAGLMDEDEGEEVTEDEAGENAEQKPQATMEELFLLTLDELEEHLAFLMSDRFGSHALRVLLVVLSGKDVEQVTTKSLLQSKKKEYISVVGAQNNTNEDSRATPTSFSLAVQKIITDTTSNLDETALRVLAIHPLGNPVLQLLLEIDHALNGKDKSKSDSMLVYKLLPGAPQMLSDEHSSASGFVGQMLYDPIGSRLLETIVEHSPAKVFKALHANFFGPRIASFVRNDIATYSAVKALNRMSKEDLADAIEKLIEQVPMLVERKRWNVLKALFERCQVRQAKEQINALLQALMQACELIGTSLWQTLCFEKEPEEQADKFQQSAATMQQKSAILSHGCKLACALLKIPGPTAREIQSNILSGNVAEVIQLATTSTATASVLITSLSITAETPNYHKALVSKLSPHALELATSQYGHNIVCDLASIPSRGERAVPFHIKQTIMTSLANSEPQMRESWAGRSVWRTWKGDLWQHRRNDWIKYMKAFDEAAVDGTGNDVKAKPWEQRPRPRIKGANAVAVSSSMRNEAGVVPAA